MDIKAKIISEIDRQISLYEDKREKTFFTGDNSSDLDEILGAIHALNYLKEQVENLNIEDYSTTSIIQGEIRTLIESQIFRPPASFLNNVLLKIKFTLDRKMSDGSRGSGMNPDAMPGRKEACEKIIKFVYNLDVELKNEQL